MGHAGLVLLTAQGTLWDFEMRQARSPGVLCSSPSGSNFPFDRLGAVAFYKLRRTHENANDLVHERQVSRVPWPPWGQQPALCLCEGAPGLLAACRGQAFGTRCATTLVSP